MEDQILLGEVVLVAGGGSGIGWAACKAFARAADVEHLIDAAVQAYGCVDIAFNNAGIEGAFERSLRMS